MSCKANTLNNNTH